MQWHGSEHDDEGQATAFHAKNAKVKRTQRARRFCGGLFVFWGVGGFAEQGQLGVEELGGEGFGEGVYGGLLGGAEGLGGEAGGGAVELLLAEGFGGELKLFDGFDCGGGRAALVVALDLGGDDGFGGFGFLRAAGLILRGYLLEVVDVVNEAAFHLVDGGIDVAGNGDIDEEDGAVAAALDEVRGLGAGEDVLAGLCSGAGGGDDDVGAVGFGVEVVERDDAGGDVGRAQGVGDFLRASLGAVGDEQRGGALLDEVTGGEVGHFAGADDQDGFAGERAEDFTREVDRDRGDGDRRAANLG